MALFRLRLGSYVQSQCHFHNLGGGGSVLEIILRHSTAAALNPRSISAVGWSSECGSCKVVGLFHLSS